MSERIGPAKQLWASLRFVAAAGASTLALVVLALSLSALKQSHDFRLASCPSLDVLSWDGNLRLIGALDQRSLFAEGHVFGALLELFSAETWPPLRDLLQHIAFAVHPEGVSVAAAVSISTLFFALLFPSGLYVMVALVGRIRGSLAFVIFAVAVTRGHEFHRYALSGMLETQGMFFMLWGTFFLLRLYSSAEPSAATREARATRIGLALSLCGVFFTKYPYGAMLLIALTCAEWVLRPRLYLDIVAELWETHYRGWRAAGVALFTVALVPLSTSGALGDSGTFARAWKAGVYVFCFALVADFYWMLFRRREYLWVQLPATMRILQLGVFVPVFIWLFGHPTRFKTVLGTQQRVVDGVGSDLFLRTLFTTSIAVPGLVAVLLLAAALATRWQKRRDEPTIAVRGNHPAAPANPTKTALAAGVFLGVNLLLLDLSTVNRQERHIFHLVPGIMLVLLFLAARGPGVLLQAVGLGLAAMLVLFSLPVGLPGLIEAPRAQDICVNPAHDFVQPARDMARDLSGGHRYVLINRYHEPSTGLPHRALATPVDLLMRMRLLGAGGILRNDNRYRYRSWRAFDRVLVVSGSCDSLTDLVVARRLSATGARLGVPVERRYGEGRYCVREYPIEGGTTR